MSILIFLDYLFHLKNLEKGVMCVRFSFLTQNFCNIRSTFLFSTRYWRTSRSSRIFSGISRRRCSVTIPYEMIYVIQFWVQWSNKSVSRKGVSPDLCPFWSNWSIPILLFSGTVSLSNVKITRSGPLYERISKPWRSEYGQKCDLRLVCIHRFDCSKNIPKNFQRTRRNFVKLLIVSWLGKSEVGSENKRVGQNRW